MIPSLGRAVHYVMPETARHPGHHRAATISQVWTTLPGDEATESTPVQLHVFCDVANDGINPPGILVVRSAVQDPYGKLPGSWHEPERTPVPGKKLETAKA
jgi:hypothetical protein